MAKELSLPHNEEEIKKILLENQKLKEKFLILEKAKQEWEITVDASPDVICLLKNDGCIVRGNLSVEKLGIKVTELTSFNIFDLLFFKIFNKDQAKLEDFKEKWQQVLQGDKVEIQVEDIANKTTLNIKLQPSWYERSLYHKKKLGKKDHINFIVTIIENVTKEVHSKQHIFELYKHLGSINRRLAVLSSLSKENYSASKDSVLRKVIKTINNVTEADICLIYDYIEEKKEFQLVIYNETSNNQKRKLIKEIAETDFPFKKELLIDKKRIQGNKACLDFNKLGFGVEVNYFVILPIIDKGKTKGVIFLLFQIKKRVDTQELDFYDLLITQLAKMYKK